MHYNHIKFALKQLYVVMKSKIIHEIHLLWRALLSLCFSHTCIVCKKTLEIDEDHICNDCKEMITFLPQKMCTRCAHPLELVYGSSITCPNCSGRKLFYSRTIALLALNQTLKTIFLHIKYYRKEWLLKLFLPYLAKRTPLLLSPIDFDYIVPVPLSPIRMFQRGFNQTYIISKMLAHITKKPILPNMLRKKIGNYASLS
ncbi:ComF family protein [Candidatus Omnitrophota bacterium]